MDLRTQSEGLAVALELGLVVEADVVAWADEQLAALAEIPDALVDVSMATGASSAKLISLLRALPGAPDPFESVQDVLRRISSGLEQDRLDPAGAARLIGALHSANRVPHPDAGSEMARLGASGASAAGDLRTFLDRYSGD